MILVFSREGVVNFLVWLGYKVLCGLGGYRIMGILVLGFFWVFILYLYKSRIRECIIFLVSFFF